MNGMGWDGIGLSLAHGLTIQYTNAGSRPAHLHQAARLGSRKRKVLWSIVIVDVEAQVCRRRDRVFRSSPPASGEIGGQDAIWACMHGMAWHGILEDPGNW